MVVLFAELTLLLGILFFSIFHRSSRLRRLRCLFRLIIEVASILMSNTRSQREFCLSHSLAQRLTVILNSIRLLIFLGHSIRRIRIGR
jgi:hypothetical protein